MKITIPQVEVVRILSSKNKKKFRREYAEMVGEQNTRSIRSTLEAQRRLDELFNSVVKPEPLYIKESFHARNGEPSEVRSKYIFRDCTLYKTTKNVLILVFWAIFAVLVLFDVLHIIFGII